MREVGAQLRQARLQRGEDLNDVAQHLRIRSSYLFGIEQGDLSAMPGRPYALGFLRTYADYLGFDGEDLITRIKSTVENLTDRTSLRIRTPMPENRLPKTPIVVISLAVVAGIYAGWSYVNRSSRMTVDTVAEVPSDLRARTTEAMSREGDEEPVVADPSIEGRDDSAAASDAGSSADPSGAAAAAQDPAAPEAGPTDEERGSLAATPDALSVQPAAGAASAVHAARNVSPNDPTAGRPATPQAGAPIGADARVILRARERAWIQVSSLAGDYLFTRTLEPGETFLVPDRSDLELWTGNARGLDVVVDGKSVPALAGGGAVRRHVSLDPDRLLEAAGRPR